MDEVKLPITVNCEREMRPIKMFRGVACREGTFDEFVVKEIKHAYGDLNVRDRTVMDIGANIGAATLHFLENGAEKVVAVEPENSNFECLSYNTADYRNVVLIHGCVDAEAGETTIYLVPKGRNLGNTSQYFRRGRKGTRSVSFAFRDLLEEYRPQALKVDCEGAEFSFLNGCELPSFVDDVVMELHLRDFPGKGKELAETFSNWEAVRPPNFKSYMATLTHWRR